MPACPWFRTFLLGARNRDRLTPRGRRHWKWQAFLQPRDLRARPFAVAGEKTRALLMEGARGTADKECSAESSHLSRAEVFHLIEDVAATRVPVLAQTVGDPLKRPDLFPISNSRQAARS